MKLIITVCLWTMLCRAINQPQLLTFGVYDTRWGVYTCKCLVSHVCEASQSPSQPKFRSQVCNELRCSGINDAFMSSSPPRSLFHGSIAHRSPIIQLPTDHKCNVGLLHSVMYSGATGVLVRRSWMNDDCFFHQENNQKLIICIQWIKTMKELQGQHTVIQIYSRI